jgi:hypothetical protein
VTNLFDRRYLSFGTFAPNARAPGGGDLAGGERVERFVTPGYPRAVTVSLAVRP